LLIVLGGGFDWLRFPLWLERPGTLEAVPVDRLMPEAHPFYSALTYPHFAVGIALIVITLALAYGALAWPLPQRRRWLVAIAAGLSNTLLSVVYPFLIILIGLTLTLHHLYCVWRSRRILWSELFLTGIVFLVPLPLFVYYATVLASNPILQRWNAQAITLSPNPLHYLLAYGPYLALAILALKPPASLGPACRNALPYLWLWIAAAALLLYTPLNPQRRFVEGVQAPLAVLATVGLYSRALPWLAERPFFRSLAQRPRYSPAGLQKMAVVLLVGLTSLIHLSIYAAALLNLVAFQPYPLFRPDAERAAMVWLGQQEDRDGAVLAAYWTGSYLPAVAGRRVVVGQRYETVEFEAKRRQVELFFDEAAAESQRLATLEHFGVDYVFWGRAERELGGFDPATADYLAPVFLRGDVTVYQVRLPGDVSR
jgi:hypothetical protein